MNELLPLADLMLMPSEMESFRSRRAGGHGLLRALHRHPRRRRAGTGRLRRERPALRGRRRRRHGRRARSRCSPTPPRWNAWRRQPAAPLRTVSAPPGSFRSMRRSTSVSWQTRPANNRVSDTTREVSASALTIRAAKSTRHSPVREVSGLASTFHWLVPRWDCSNRAGALPLFAALRRS